jgi:hypothetical protein
MPLQRQDAATSSARASNLSRPPRAPVLLMAGLRETGLRETGLLKTGLLKTPPAGGSSTNAGASMAEGGAAAPAAEGGVDGESMSGIANPSGVASPPAGSSSGAPAAGVQLGMQRCRGTSWTTSRSS